MIAALLLAATAAPAAPPPTFEGVSLGDDLLKVATAHDAHKTFTGIGPAFTWRRPGGGIVLISGGADGKIALVDFSADQGETDSVTLPVVGEFNVRSNHGDFETAFGTGPADECRPTYFGGVCGGYDVRGGSELVLQFEGPGSGPLRRATWATHSTLDKLHVLPQVISPTPQ